MYITYLVPNLFCLFEIGNHAQIRGKFEKILYEINAATIPENVSSIFLFQVRLHIYTQSQHSKPIPKFMSSGSAVVSLHRVAFSRLASKYYFTPHNARGERSRFAISRKAHLLLLIIGWNDRRFIMGGWWFSHQHHTIAHWARSSKLV